MILALSLLNPWMLLGLLLAAVPLLIHLFYRRRYQEVRWAAVMFLSGAVRRNAQKHRLQQLLLLTIRTLAIALLVLGFTRPLLTSAIGSQSASAPRHRIFVVDGSLSMRCSEEAGTRFEKAIGIVRDVVNNSGETDSFRFALIQGDQIEQLSSRPIADKAEATKLLEAAQCSAARGTPGRVFPLLTEWLEDLPSDRDVEITWLSDFQAAEWSGGDSQQLADSMALLEEAAEVKFVNVAESSTANVSVTSIKPDAPFITTSDVASLVVSLRNFGDQPVVERPVRLLVDEQVVATQTVSLDGLSSQSIRFTHRIPTAGRYRLQAEIDPDRLSEDNAARCVLRVFEAAPVLLINGRPSSREMGDSTDFLRLSLDPLPAASDVRTPYAVRVVSEVELAAVDFADYSAVFACDVRQFTADESIRLRDYVYGGGGLVICVGDSSDLKNYNARLFTSDGVLPGVRLDSIVGSAKSPKRGFVFDADRLDHPLMALYRGNPGHGLESVLTFQYVKASLKDETASDAALLFENGDPAIVQANVGAGSAALVAIAGDDSRWSTWNTASGTYVSLMNELAESAVLAGETNQHVTVGDAFSRSMSIRAGEEPVVAFSDGTAVKSRISESESGKAVVVERISMPGFVSIRTDRFEQLVACDVDDAESDLRTTVADKLIVGNTQFPAVSPAELLSSVGNRTASKRNEASFALFLVVLALLGAEQLLASRVGKIEWIVFLASVGLVVAALVIPKRQTLAVLLIPALIAAGLLARKWLLPKLRTSR